MAEVMLNRAGVVSVVGELEAAGVPEHVRVNGKDNARDLPNA
jgi:hypothetical protein